MKLKKSAQKIINKSCKETIQQKFTIYVFNKKQKTNFIKFKAYVIFKSLNQHLP